MATQAGNAFGGNNQIPAGPRDLYGYPFLFTAVTNAIPQTQNVTIEQDGDFFLNQVNYYATTNGVATQLTSGTRVLPRATIQMTDQGSGRNLFFGPMPIPAFAGWGSDPGYLVHPRKIGRASTFTLTILSYDATNVLDTLYICLIGFKVYGNPGIGAQ